MTGKMVTYYESMTTKELIMLLVEKSLTLREGLIIAVILEKRIPKVE